jgi:deoxyuridine 5'-triphosphate nucleotidohydrolase
MMRFPSRHFSTKKAVCRRPPFLASVLCLVTIPLPILFACFLLCWIMTSSLSLSTSASGFRAAATLSIKRLSDQATLPKRGSEFSAGLDLASAEAKVIPAGERALVKTDLAIACPADTYARIAPRSGLALKKGIDVGAGVIDADYRGPVGVILFNWGKEDFEIKVGDRIAQMILEKIVLPEIVETDDLPETVRGAGGFGSTGVEEALPEESSPKKQRTVSPSSSADAAKEEEKFDAPGDETKN